MKKPTEIIQEYYHYQVRSKLLSLPVFFNLLALFFRSLQYPILKGRLNNRERRNTLGIIKGPVRVSTFRGKVSYQGSRA